jgi:hypothetical protein
MTLHHHPHSSAQKRLWSSNTWPLLFLNSSKHASLQASHWHDSLRRAGFISVATTTQGGASSASAAEAVGDGDLVAEDGTTSASMTSSSRTSSSSSSESLRTMILSSPGGPRISQLMSSKSLLANSSSRDVSGMRPSSFEDEERSNHWGLGGGTTLLKHRRAVAALGDLWRGLHWWWRPG